ncbi:MAG: DinB family protein, partial [Saprospiraceae bacterium]|nr:DinB family protein [Saprospiraceae bacterium]
MIEELLREIDQEATTSRKMLERIPADKFGWKPHAKSMTIERLSNHIAELPGWIGVTLNTEQLDFAVNPYEPTSFDNTGDLLAFFERTLE